jgi:hypothetical protein
MLQLLSERHIDYADSADANLQDGGADLIMMHSF